MRKDKLLVLGAFVVAVAAAIGFQAIGGGDGSTAPSRPARTTRQATGTFRGISLQFHNGEADHPYEQYIDEIAAAGANAICFVPTAYQENCASSSLFIEARKTPSRERILKLMQHARSRGLRTAVMPIVLLENPREGEWRGKIEPANWDDWWEDYGNYILHYAKIAQEGGAEIFLVGSELVYTESHADRWRKLIAMARQEFKGLLSYSANWDHYDVIEWWDDLDLIGMTTYYDLTGGKKPEVDRLLEAWKPIKEKVRTWQATIGKPILFTEVGWPNQVTAAQYPWDYYRSETQPDAQAQANCFEAFFRTWIDEPDVAGFLVWEWRNHPQQEGGPEDTSYIPCGKPALRIISRYFQHAGAKRTAMLPGGQALPASRPSGSVSP